jgi:predicted DNA-binding antitoxin AbrB/MazE fold protein
MSFCTWIEKEITMSQIDAIYRHGVFEPLAPVDLQEEQRVRLSVEPVNNETPQQWLERVKALQAAILNRHGEFLPDSAPGIAEDRMR